jgi:hypothetical protein
VQPHLKLGQDPGEPEVAGSSLGVPGSCRRGRVGHLGQPHRLVAVG